jgi:catechol 2,3-dioxygenase-like lactoylglutathione lyase family enzyme
MSVVVCALDHVVINVTNLVASAEWYQRVLGVTPQIDGGGGVPTTFTFGAQALRLRPVSASKDDWFTADHEAAGSDDLCFLTKSSSDEVIDHLSACGISVERGPVEQHGGYGRLVSVYCRDPDGSLIEIASSKN